MVYTKQDFNARVGNVDKKKSHLVRRGYTTKVDKNGIIIAKPKARRIRFPLRGLVLLVLGFIGLKAFMIAAASPVTYQDRITALEAGSVIEVAAARVLAPDPVTQFLADTLAPFLR